MLMLGLRRFPTLSTATLSMAVAMLAFAQQIVPAGAEPRASEFKLANGMQVVVIPDHRAPVVTHMVWYKVGAADEPKGVSGIAHFLEHLMFKSTDKIAVGEFSKIISRLGGQDNAFTGQDVTSYLQRIAKEQLGTVMDMEADRMVNLRLTAEEVATERQVILEERRSRIDNNPTALLDEQMNAALYLSHPYGIPVIGWEHEMAKLSREDALRFYKRYYAPNNAILVVSGDVTPEEVKRLAEQTYGKVPANPDVDGRVRPQEPPQIAARRARAEGPARRQRLVPPLLRRAELLDRQAGRGRGARPPDEDRGRRLDEPPLQEARRRRQDRRDLGRRLSPAGASTAARSRSTRSPATASASTRSRRRSTACWPRCAPTA